MMNKVYECCCGLDVHKDLIVACLVKGNKPSQLQNFGTTTDEIESLAKWLIEEKCEMIAMESTGSYWKPIYNILELVELNAIVVNAHHMKNVPGRKTDDNDARWIAKLLRHGLLNGSYIPDRDQRELREITRYKKSLVQERSRELNRLQKMLEGANIKLSSVVSEIDGKSAQALLRMIISNTEMTEDIVKTLIHGSMMPKLDFIVKALKGKTSPLQRKLIASVIDHIDDMTRRIEDIDKLIKEHLDQYGAAVEQLDTIPGIGPSSAMTILAEIGLDMSRFPTAGHLCSWAGLSPGNNISAGKSKSSKTTRGNPTLKTTLIQCAKAAVKNKSSFLYAQYQRLVVRKGKNKSTVAVAHTMLIAIYHMLKDGSSFVDLGSDYYNSFNPEKKIQSYLIKLKKLGWSPPALEVV